MSKELLEQERLIKDIVLTEHAKKQVDEKDEDSYENDAQMISLKVLNKKAQKMLDANLAYMKRIRGLERTRKKVDDAHNALREQKKLVLLTSEAIEKTDQLN